MLPFYFIKRVPFLKRNLSRMYLDRAYQIAPKIIPHLLKKDRILDIGCGTGSIARVLRKKGVLDITLVDVFHNEMCEDYPVVIYDGDKLPFKDKEFHVALLMAVLHHAKDPMRVLDEAVRVSSGQVIVMEDVFDDFFSRMVTFIGDCLVNWEIHSPFRNHTREKWVDIFQNKKLGILDIKQFKLRCIGFPFQLAIFVLSTKNPAQSKKAQGL